MNRAKFYAALRRRDSGVFGTSLSQGQVEGVERLLDVWNRYYAKDGSAEELAYDLGTSYHETAHTMQPITERGRRSYFNKYEPGTRLGRVLGNTQPGDGYRFRGEGDVQNTGRRNARVSSRRLNEVFGLKIDFEKNPSLRGDPFWSAHCLFLGNREGWWTGKDIDDFIDGIDESDAEDLREYRNARRIVNGTDKANAIARYALAFERALKAGGYNGQTVSQKPVEPPEPVPPPMQPEQSETPSQTAPEPAESGFFHAIVKVLAAMFARKPK